MEQHRIREDPIEAAGRQVEREQVLLPDLAAAVLARNRGQRRGTFKANNMVTELAEALEIAARAAAQVEQFERRGRLDMPQQGIDVLADVVVARAFPEGLCALLVVGQRRGGGVHATLS